MNKTTERAIETLRGFGWYKSKLSFAELSAEHFGGSGEIKGLVAPPWAAKAMAIADANSAEKKEFRPIILIVPKVEDVLFGPNWLYGSHSTDRWLIISTDGYQLTTLRLVQSTWVETAEHEGYYAPISFAERLNHAAGWVKFRSGEVKALDKLDASILVTNSHLYIFSDKLSGTVLMRRVALDRDPLDPFDIQKIIGFATKTIGKPTVETDISKWALGPTWIWRALKNFDRYQPDFSKAVAFETIPYGENVAPLLRIRGEIHTTTDLYMTATTAALMDSPIKSRDADTGEVGTTLKEVSATTELFTEV